MQQYEDRLTIATPEGVTIDVVLAGVASRIIAGLLDVIIQTAVLGAFVFLAVRLGEAGAWDLSEWVVNALFALTFFLVFFFYHVLFETLGSGRSPGKRATGLRVTTVEGGAVGFKGSFIRNLLRIVDWLPLWYVAGIISILASSRNQRLGDMVGGCLVVRDDKIKSGELTAVALTGSNRSVEGASAWDLSAITPDDMAVIRRYLQRRGDLKSDARDRLAGEIAARIRPKVGGVSATHNPDRFLEMVAAAKSARA